MVNLHVLNICTPSVDAIALRIMVILCIRIGTYEILRDTLSRVLPFWDKKKESEFYPHVLSL